MSIYLTVINLHAIRRTDQADLEPQCLPITHVEGA